MVFYCHNKTKNKFLQANLLELFFAKLLHYIYKTYSTHKYVKHLYILYNIKLSKFQAILTLHANGLQALNIEQLFVSYYNKSAYCMA